VEKRTAALLLLVTLAIGRRTLDCGIDDALLQSCAILTPHSARPLLQRSQTSR